MAAFLARTLDVLVDQDRAAGRYRDDVAPVVVRLDQQGRLVEAGSALTGSVTGDRVARVRLSSAVRRHRGPVPALLGAHRPAGTRSAAAR
jgi:hypothetical protein